MSERMQAQERCNGGFSSLRCPNYPRRGSSLCAYHKELVPWRESKKPKAVTPEDE